MAGGRDVHQVVLMSGGLDSLVTLASALEAPTPGDTTCLFFDYGQQNSERERSAATRICEHYGCQLVCHAVGIIGESALLTRSGMRLASAREERSDAVSSAYVPLRSLLFFTFAGQLAETLGAEDLWVGVSEPGPADPRMPDAEGLFLSAAEVALNLGSTYALRRERLRLVAPLLYMSKADVYREGLRLAAPLHLAWSCFKGGAVPCGECGPCVARSQEAAILREFSGV